MAGETLIGWLTEKQRAAGLTDEEFGRTLVDPEGRWFSQENWCQLRRGVKGKRGPSLRLIRAACLAYPECCHEILRLTIPECASA